MKKKIAFVFLLAILLPNIAFPYDFKVDGIYYNRNNGNVEVTYKDTNYNSYSGDVTIPDNVSFNGTTYPVTAIGSHAFCDCTDLTSVNIPNSVTAIGTSAFYSSKGLSYVNIPSSVTSIGKYAFEFCYGLSSITIPNSVTFIDRNAFAGCLNMTKVIITDLEAWFNITFSDITSNPLSSAHHLFLNDREIHDLIIPNSIKTINNNAFYSCQGLTSITIPQSVTSIGENAFNNTCLTNVNIPKSVNHIGYKAFYTYGEVSLSICGNIDSIGESTFYRVKELYLSDEVSIIPSLGISPNTIYSYAMTPPTCQDDTFTAYTGILHIPAASLASYFTAPIWERFDNLVNDAIVPCTLSLNPNELELPLGEQTYLTATVLPNNAYPNNIIWKSTNPLVATVSNGNVIAIARGECDIIASCLFLQSVCHVVVIDNNIVLTLDQHEALVLPNHMITLTVSASSDALPELSVISSDPSVVGARISNGTIRVVGIKEGSATLIVSSVDGTAQTDSCVVTVYTEMGDVNCDGFINISDVTSLIDYLLGIESTSFKYNNSDLNEDGIVNIADVTKLIDLLLFESPNL